MCGKENLPTLFEECGLSGHYSGSSRGYILTAYTHVRSYSVASLFSSPKLLQLTSLAPALQYLPVMPRLDIDTRRRVVFLKSAGYSVSQIKKRLQEENILVSSQALFNLLKKFKDTGKLIDLLRRTRPRKLSREMMVFLNEALSENDELTARQAHSLLVAKWPTVQVSLPTIKRVRQKIGWVCTRPHYCQLLREVSCMSSVI